MENKSELVTNSFPERFGQFLEAHDKMNPNSLAVKMTQESNPEEAKPLAVKYGRWLNGKATPSFESLVDLAIKFNLDMNWLMRGIGSMTLGEAMEANVIEKPGQSLPVVLPGQDTQNAELIKLRLENEFKDKRLEDKDDLIADLKDQIEYLKKDKDQLYSITSTDRKPIPLKTGAKAAKGSFSVIDNLSRPYSFKRVTNSAFQDDCDMLMLVQHLGRMVPAQG